MNTDDYFIQLYDLYVDDVLRLAISFTKNITDAEDITQMVFIKLYKQLEKYQEREFNKQWLLKVTANEAKNFLRENWHKKVFCHNELIELEMDDKEIKIDDTSKKLLELPKKYRIVLYLYYYEGYKVEEIANILNLKIENVRTLIRRGREKLKLILKEEYNYVK